MLWQTFLYLFLKVELVASEELSNSSSDQSASLTNSTGWSLVEQMLAIAESQRNEIAIINQKSILRREVQLSSFALILPNCCSFNHTRMSMLVKAETVFAIPYVFPKVGEVKWCRAGTNAAKLLVFNTANFALRNAIARLDDTFYTNFLACVPLPAVDSQSQNNLYTQCFNDQIALSRARLTAIASEVLGGEPYSIDKLGAIQNRLQAELDSGA